MDVHHVEELVYIDLTVAIAMSKARRVHVYNTFQQQGNSLCFTSIKAFTLNKGEAYPIHKADHHQRTSKQVKVDLGERCSSHQDVAVTSCHVLRKLNGIARKALPAHVSSRSHFDLQKYLVSECALVFFSRV